MGLTHGDPAALFCDVSIMPLSRETLVLTPTFVRSLPWYVGTMRVHVRSRGRSENPGAWVSCG